MPGPPPKAADQRARRNATLALTQLPASGRPGRAPTWPLTADLETETKIHLAKREIAQIEDDGKWETTARERASQRRKLARLNKTLAELEALKKHLHLNERKLWVDLWKTPQATQWEKLGWTREVALYVRHQVKAEGGSLDDAKEARQMSDRLGLTPLALLRLRWEIVDQIAQRTAPAPRGGRQGQNRYRDLRVVS